MKTYGLIGKTLSHSFSKGYFTEKFRKEGIEGCQYELFELPAIADFKELLRSRSLAGLNVTVPYKEEVIPFLDRLTPEAARIGAVNVIRFLPGGILEGANSDYFGFRRSLEHFLGEQRPAALVLGTGGASKAVAAALQDMGIAFRFVSRTASADVLAYSDLNADLLQEYPLLINTTPLGMYPHIQTCPDIPFQHLSNRHFVFDLVYNPEQTLLMKKAADAGAAVQNGLEMLYLQAEEAWRMWNE